LAAGRHSPATKNGSQAMSLEEIFAVFSPGSWADASSESRQTQKRLPVFPFPKAKKSLPQPPVDIQLVDFKGIFRYNKTTRR